MYEYDIAVDDRLIEYLLNITDPYTVEVIKNIVSILLEKGINEVGTRLDEIVSVDDIDKDPSAVLDEILSILKSGIIRYSRRLGIMLDEGEVNITPINKLLDYLVTVASISEIGLPEALVIDTILQTGKDLDTFNDILFTVNPNIDINTINRIVNDVYSKFFDVLRNAVNDIIKANDDIIADESTTIEDLSDLIEEYTKSKLPKCSAYVNLLINPDLIYVYVNSSENVIDKYIDELKLVLKAGSNDDIVDIVRSIVFVAYIGNADINEILSKLKDVLEKDFSSIVNDYYQLLDMKLRNLITKVRESYKIRTEDE